MYAQLHHICFHIWSSIRTKTSPKSSSFQSKLFIRWETITRKSICSKKFWFSKRLYEVNYANCPKQPQRTIFFIKDTFSVKLISLPLVRQFINHSFQISWLGISLILFIRVSVKMQSIVDHRNEKNGKI